MQTIINKASKTESVSEKSIFSHEASRHFILNIIIYCSVYHDEAGITLTHTHTLTLLCNGRTIMFITFCITLTLTNVHLQSDNPTHLDKTDIHLD